ncbi:RNA polymerase-binding protein DksA [bacterium]|nr:RNA polymerase-binding protein DksA [candidate division CSSED10-310 bacterium]
MDKEQIEYFRRKLLNWRRQLIDEAMKTLGEGNIKAPTEFRDYTDLASDEAERNFLLRIKDRERKLIKKIEQTLRKVEEGTFGICEECGDEIGFDRLDARPVASLCIACKTEQERFEG